MKQCGRYKRHSAGGAKIEQYGRFAPTALRLVTAQGICPSGVIPQKVCKDQQPSPVVASWPTAPLQPLPLSATLLLSQRHTRTPFPGAPWLPLLPRAAIGGHRLAVTTHLPPPPWAQPASPPLRLFQIPRLAPPAQILYFDPLSGRQLKANQRDTPWAGWSCLLGFPVMGIWFPDSDGSMAPTSTPCTPRRRAATC